MGRRCQNLNDVENALNRIENNTYGECEVCDKQIEEKTLRSTTLRYIMYGAC